VARRRLALLGAVAGLALVAGAVTGAGDDSNGETGERAGGADAERAARRLSLGERVGQLLVVSFPGRTPPAYVLDILAEGRASGVILFGGNVSSPAQTRRLTRSLQRAARGSALIATDQEGGAIRILPWAAPRDGQPAQTTPATAAGAAAAAARDLRAAGVNVTLAPVADIATTGGALRGRSYPGDAEQVSRLVGAAVAAYRRGRVGSTVKHFPGLGRAKRNTDDVPVTIGGDRSGLEAADLPPFAAAVKAGAPLVMASHALYPAFDRVRIASQSPPILLDLLHRRLAFGVALVGGDRGSAVGRLRRRPGADDGAGQLPARVPAAPVGRPPLAPLPPPRGRGRGPGAGAQARAWPPDTGAVTAAVLGLP
jgi:beta-N-acetylhexosaminidase